MDMNLKRNDRDEISPMYYRSYVPTRQSKRARAQDRCRHPSWVAIVPRSSGPFCYTERCRNRDRLLQNRGRLATLSLEDLAGRRHRSGYLTYSSQLPRRIRPETWRSLDRLLAQPSPLSTTLPNSPPSIISRPKRLISEPPSTISSTLTANPPPAICTHPAKVTRDALHAVHQTHHRLRLRGGYHRYRPPNGQPQLHMPWKRDRKAFSRGWSRQSLSAGGRLV